MAIGQEVGVTPVQLVTMVSTIANGGVYMPPHVLLQSTDQMKGDARLKPAAFRPSNQLPDQLPDGAHRVIKELTSAKMRMMMQGIVVEGSGRLAALNGYSAGGKTGTAQKVDPVTHTYSHTKLVASFAGFAPVSNPAISVAVVIDTPTMGTRYGAQTSAPVFAEVSQQVLEYLGVPHDQPLKTKKEMVAAATPKDGLEDGPSDNGADLDAMFADVNNLPADDSVASLCGWERCCDAEDGAKQVAASAPVVPPPAAKKPVAKSATVTIFCRQRCWRLFRARSGLGPQDGASSEAASVDTKAAPRAGGASGVTVDAGRKVAVPVFDGASLRTVVERAGDSRTAGAAGREWAGA